MEGLDRSDVKKPKLDNEDEDEAIQAQDAATDQVEDADMELPEEAIDDPVPYMEVDQSASASTEETKKIRFKKTKTAEGASAHFKENPYTFIASDDALIKSCM